MSSSRKPHLLKVKQEIVSLIDDEISIMKTKIDRKEYQQEFQAEVRRELAIWIRQRNKIARDADIEPIELPNKDGQGKITY